MNLKKFAVWNLPRNEVQSEVDIACWCYETPRRNRTISIRRAPDCSDDIGCERLNVDNLWTKPHGVAAVAALNEIQITSERMRSDYGVGFTWSIDIESGSGATCS